MKTGIPISPAVLKWAREQQGLSLEEVSVFFKKDIEIVSSWEEGLLNPSYSQLEKLAYTLYKRPIALFFFPNPPQEKSLAKSFRTLPTTEIDKIPSKLRTLIRKAKAMQIGICELVEQKTMVLKDFETSPSLPLEDITQAVREYLDIPLEKQYSWKDDSEALLEWRRAIEKKGVFVFKEAFHTDKYSGFCLHDDYFPLIYINNTQSKNRQIFTLFHEFAHLLFGVGGIEIPDDSYISTLHGEAKLIEIICNKFAGSFLVPEDAFQKDIENQTVSEDLINSLSVQYKVSREVILRRFFSQGLITSEKYRYFVEKWKMQGKEKKTKKGGGDYYNNQGVYISEHYANIVFQKYYNNRLSLSDVANYLGVKVKNVEGIETSFLKKQFA
ncbi:MAG: XRE family transcriptional regulator [Candidatus Peregrinibacteria bacterium]